MGAQIIDLFVSELLEAVSSLHRISRELQRLTSPLDAWSRRWRDDGRRDGGMEGCLAGAEKLKFSSLEVTLFSSLPLFMFAAPPTPRTDAPAGE